MQSFYDLKTTTLTGKPADLGDYRGKVALVVNVASYCGYTPQYKGLEALNREMQSKGVVVLGFPSNDFGEQEPGTAEEIQQFCKLTYDVTFPMFSKLVTRLEDRLGVQLLHRTTRRLSLSSEGDVYFARAQQILSDIDEVEIEVTRSRGAPRGRLRINTSNGFGIHQLAPALPQFMARYPDIEVDLAMTDRIVDVSADPADVIIRAGPVADVAALWR